VSAEGLGIELRRALARAKLSQAGAAKRADVPAPWFRQVVGGRIKRPRTDRLRAVCTVLGVDYARALALTDQLGAAVEPGPDSDLVSAVRAQTAALGELVAELRRTKDRDLARDEAIERLIEHLSGRPPGHFRPPRPSDGNDECRPMVADRATPALWLAFQ